MPEPFRVVTVEEARSRLRQRWQVPPLSVEEVDLAQAQGRVLAREVLAPEPLPGFARATVDGYAVRSVDTHGAGEALPAWLQVQDEIAMGQEANRPLAPGACARVATGGMLPPGADAVVMVEHTQTLGPGEIEILRPAAPGENRLGPDEDAGAGDRLLEPGRHLRAPEIGVLAAAGVVKVPVYQLPSLALLSSGDELVEPGAPVHPGQVRDINSYSLRARTQALGARVTYARVLPDRREDLEAALAEARTRAQAVVMTGGTSVGAGDHAARAIDNQGEPGILVHGVAIRPGKPTIIGLADSTPIFGLSGNPVSALVTFDVFVRPVIETLRGGALPSRGTVRAELAANIPSAPGREDYLRVQMEWRDGRCRVHPFPGKAGLITTLAEAQGLVRIPWAREGLPAGEMVEVIPMD